jgi:hypothetical protein
MESPIDKSHAENIKKQLGANPDVEDVIVIGDLLQLHVSEDFYHRLAVDRDRGRKIVLMLMQKMKQLTEQPEVTVWVYCQKEKVIEGKAKSWGGDNVMYVKDL